MLPVLAGWVVSFVAAFAGWMGGYMEAVRQHLAANGNGTSDEVVLEALQDPAFQQEIQRAMQSDPELGMTVLAAGAWPSYFGFWLVIALFAVWFALMKPRQRAG